MIFVLVISIKMIKVSQVMRSFFADRAPVPPERSWVTLSESVTTRPVCKYLYNATHAITVLWVEWRMF